MCMITFYFSKSSILYNILNICFLLLLLQSLILDYHSYTNQTFPYVNSTCNFLNISIILYYTIIFNFSFIIFLILPPFSLFSSSSFHLLPLFPSYRKTTFYEYRSILCVDGNKPWNSKSVQGLNLYIPRQIYQLCLQEIQLMLIPLLP